MPDERRDEIDGPDTLSRDQFIANFRSANTLQVKLYVGMECNLVGENLDRLVGDIFDQFEKGLDHKGVMLENLHIHLDIPFRSKESGCTILRSLFEISKEMCRRWNYKPPPGRKAEGPRLADRIAEAAESLTTQVRIWLVAYHGREVLGDHLDSLVRQICKAAVTEPAILDEIGLGALHGPARNSFRGKLLDRCLGVLADPQFNADLHRQLRVDRAMKWLRPQMIAVVSRLSKKHRPNPLYNADDDPDGCRSARNGGPGRPRYELKDDDVIDDALAEVLARPDLGEILIRSHEAAIASADDSKSIPKPILKILSHAHWKIRKSSSVRPVNRPPGAILKGETPASHPHRDDINEEPDPLSDVDDRVYELSARYCDHLSRVQDRADRFVVVLYKINRANQGTHRRRHRMGSRHGEQAGQEDYREHRDSDGGRIRSLRSRRRGPPPGPSSGSSGAMTRGRNPVLTRCYHVEHCRSYRITYLYS